MSKTRHEKVVANRVVYLALCHCMALSIAGCDRTDDPAQPGPEEVLNKYTDAYLKGRSEEAYGYVSSEDKAEKSFNEYRSKSAEVDNPFATSFESNVGFNILKVTESGNTAKANVEITLPDMGAIIRDLMGGSFLSAFRSKDTVQIEKMIAQRYESGEVPTMTEIIEFDLVEEKDGWKIVLGWKAPTAANEEAQ